MIPIYVNGKFLAQRPTGVQRSAREWLDALDALLAQQATGEEQWTVLHPPGSVAPGWRRIATRVAGCRDWPLHAWEQWTLPRAAASGLLVSLAGSAPWFAARQIVTIHDAAVWDCPEAYSRPFRLWYRSLFRHLAHTALSVMTVSEFSRSRLVLHLEMSDREPTVIPNGSDHLGPILADHDAGRRLGIAGPYVLAVASANPSKNLDRLARAVQALDPALDVTLVLVGGSNPRVFASHDLPDGRHMRRLGTVDDATLKALIQGALALAVPSLYEGCGLPALEAMACGCPVLASNAAALPETCGDAAFYVDPLSIESITRGLQLLATDDQWRRSLIERGRDRARSVRWRDGAARLRAHVLSEADRCG